MKILTSEGKHYLHASYVCYESTVALRDRDTELTAAKHIF